MTAWWQSLTTLEQVLLYIAIPATLILIIQTVLLFVGGGLGVEEGDGAPEGDWDADPELDPDAGDGGPELEPDSPGDLPEGGGDDSGQGRAQGGLHIFTLRGIIAFLTLFGWGGLWLCQLGLPPLAAAFLAVPIGFAGMVIIALIIREALRLQHDGTLDPRNALGRTGEVYLTVPPGGQGTGKVTLLVQEQLREFEARTGEPLPIPTGTPIRVVGLSGEVLLVEPHQPDEKKER